MVSKALSYADMIVTEPMRKLRRFSRKSERNNVHPYTPPTHFIKDP